LTNEYEISDFNANTVKKMLEFIYGKDTIKEDTELAEDLIKLAHRFEVENLVTRCEQLLLENINLDTLIRYLPLADLLQGSNLRAKCVEFIKANRQAFRQSPGCDELFTKYPNLAKDVCF
jgi:speckle-type POZ protein